MNDIQFNLLDEPWIRVMKQDCSVVEVSLTDVLLHAHEYQDLAGELPTQDVAVMRVLLAVLHTVFERFDANGNPETLDEENVLDRWEELWNLKAFPEKPIRNYLDQWHERFWLFHPERPFFQVPNLEIAHIFKSPKLNGAISESNNKIRLFSSRAGEKKGALSYAEAARWLISIISFDDNVGAKPIPTGQNIPSCGVGWLGQLGLLVAQGKNLFETLLLNLVLLRNGQKPWGKNKPIWEKQDIETRQNNKIPLPDNPSELYTLQSRRILLLRKNELVTEYKTLGGDFFDGNTSFSWEPMTLWRNDLDENNNIKGYKPYLHDKSKQIWQIFPKIVGIEDNAKLAGVVSWITFLTGMIPDIQKNMIRFKITSVTYGGGSQKSSIENIFSDFLSIHTNLLLDSGKQWRNRIYRELIAIDKRANLIWKLSNDISIASGWKKGIRPKTENIKANRDKEQYYYLVNEPLRIWLTKLSSDQDLSRMNTLQLEWRETATKIADKLGQEIVDKSGIGAFIGRRIKTEENNTIQFCTAPKAFIRFINSLYHIYDSDGA